MIFKLKLALHDSEVNYLGTNQHHISNMSKNLISIAICVFQTNDYAFKK